jgi:hypothetical protein
MATRDNLEPPPVPFSAPVKKEVTYASIHKTAGQLLSEFPRSPPDLAASLTEYVNAQQAAGQRLVGINGDTTNFYFTFRST